MSEYRCSQCGATYNRYEYDALDKQPLNPEDDDPMQGSGYERICECGSGFHTDKWQMREVVDTEDGEIDVSTVALLIPHGPSHTQWFETCLFHDSGSRVIRRYHTQEEAEDGHAEVVENIGAGRFHFEPTGKRFVMGGPDE